MLKNAYFLAKICKNRLSIGAPPPNPFAFENSFLVLNAFYFRSKENQVTTANVLPLLFPQLCT